MADYATLVFDIDSTQARGAAKALSDLNSAAIRAANGAASIGTTMRDASGRFQQAAKLTEKNIREVESLAKAYNPLLAAQIRYKEEVLRTATAVKAGVITEQQRIDILQRTKAELDGSAAAARRLEAEERKVAAAAERAAAASARASGAVKALGKSQETATHHATNLSFQLNDIGMMMASGQSPFLLMMQQGPQVAQIFSQMNAEGRKIGPTLASAFKMFLNPTTLATLAIIGGTAALAQWAVGSDKAASSTNAMTDRIDSLKAAYQSLEAAQSAQNASLDKQIEKYGQYWLSIRRVTEQLALNAQEAARQEANSAIAALGFDPRAMQGYENQIKAFMQARNDMSSESRRIAIEALGLQQESIELYGLQFDEVQRLIAIQDRLKSNDLGLNERNRLSAEFNELLSRGAQNGAKLKSEMIAAGDSALKLTDEMSRAAANTEAANRAMSRFSQTASSASLSHLVSQAAQLASNLRAASSIANALGGRAETFAGGVFDVVKGAYQKAMDKIDEIDANGLSDRPKARPFSVSERALWGPEETGGKGGGGGAAERQAAAELKAAEKGFQSLRELLEKESLFQFAEYEKRQLQLDTALKKQLITRQEYDEYQKQLRINYFGTEYQQQQLRYDLEHQQLKDALERQKITREEYAAIERQNQWRQVSELGTIRDTGVAYDLSKLAEGFGQAASMAGDYNSKFLKAQRVFAASAALISTYQGAAKALELPFPMNIAAAAKVLAAGMGFISAIKSGGSGGSSGGGGASSAGTVKQEPTRNVLVRLEGDAWLTDMAEQMMTQIYEASSNGRVIIARDNS